MITVEQRPSNAIPLCDLKLRTVYRLNSRNLSLGVYDGINGFYGIRTKFGSRFIDHEQEWDTSEHYGTAVALSEIGTIPEPIVLGHSLGTECNKCRQSGVSFDDTQKKWLHADGTPLCEKAWAVSIGNDPLFDALLAVEEKIDCKANRRPNLARGTNL
jgi:hypothetical protein